MPGGPSARPHECRDSNPVKSGTPYRGDAPCQRAQEARRADARAGSRTGRDARAYRPLARVAVAFRCAQTYMPAMSTLKFGDSGPYGELVQRTLPEGLALVFVPSLAALLVEAQEINGGALTE